MEGRGHLGVGEFRGLFIGIDRYQSPDIGWLSGAARDALALYALFSDTFGGDSQLLCDDDATRSTIEGAFADLINCDSDDVVVISFSGHGTPTHQLVTFDADVLDLDSTCIPLELLTEWFSRIPARRLICILDCCFSGGAGARVLAVPTPRELTSVSTLLDQLSGQGRLLITASMASEEALEDPRLGHGLLTYYLIEGLLGAEEVRESGQVSVYRLLQHVASRVIGMSQALGQVQNPTLRGSIDGEFRWPIFTPGHLYTNHFPSRVRKPAEANVASLSNFGFIQSVIDAWAASIGTLNQLQLDAINEFGVLDGEHLMVVAPTSSGKTMVGELTAIQAALERKRAFFLMPLRALVNDKHQEFVRRYGTFGISVIRATGEVSDDIPALMKGQYDICLMTYEKFTALALSQPHLLRQVGVIVIDEVQMIADPGRGVNLEFLLTLLRARRLDGIEPQLVALSGVVGQTNSFERWLGGRLLRREERPVPLDEGIVLANGTYRYVSTDDDEEKQERLITPQFAQSAHRGLLVPLVRRLVEEGKQVIVFRQTQGEARACAVYLAQELGLPPADAAMNELPQGDPSNSTETLRTVLMGGVAFHISDLDREERRIVEEHFRRQDGQLRVIAATTTLAMGVNTPAEAVVIAGLMHPFDQPYSVAEYKNMVGRAGRLGLAERGSSYLIVAQEGEHGYWRTYVNGEPEDLESRLLNGENDLRSLILRILAGSRRIANVGLTADEVVAFLSSSFDAFRREAMGSPLDQRHVAAALGELVRFDLVSMSEDGKHDLTELGQIAGQSGTEVESVLRLVRALGECSPDELTEPTLIAATHITKELDDLYFPFNRRSNSKEPTAWPQELNRQGVARSIQRGMSRNLIDEHTQTQRSKKAVATMLWMSDMPMVDIEQTLMRFSGSAVGASGPVRGVAQRTMDLLPIVVRIAEVIHPSLNLSGALERMMVRLAGGLPSSGVELARVTRGSLSRPEYLSLLRQGLNSLDSLKAASDDVLLACLINGDEKLEALRDLLAQVEPEDDSLTLAIPRYES